VIIAPNDARTATLPGAVLKAAGPRLILATTLAALLLLWLGRSLIELLLPMFAWVFSVAQPDFQAAFALSLSATGEIVTATAQTTVGVAVAPGLYLPPATRLNTVWTELIHALVPAAILLAGLLAWPLSRPREILWRAAVGLPSVFVVFCLTTPLYLAGRVEMLIMQAAAAREMRAVPFHSPLILWTVFTEMGGRWLLPIVLAVSSIRIARQLSEYSAAGQRR
jgi:hypothetical protein